MKKNSIVVVLRAALGFAVWFLITIGFTKILGPRLPKRIPEIITLIVETMIIPYTVGLAGFFAIAGNMEKKSPEAEIQVTSGLILKSLIIQLGLSIPVVTVINIIIKILVGKVGSNLSADLFGENRIFYAVLLLLFNPIFEELLFRKMILERLLILGQKETIIISAVLFAIPHAISQGIPQMFATFIVALVWGTIRIKTGKLWPCMILHSLFNLFCGYIITALSGNPAGAVAVMFIFMIFLPVLSVFLIKLK
ncbi:MAG: CPBP family intramembrane metalloprotease [Butyrivibrio sp.]|uniref:CPBP family intramembrane glutamic endopeptidase n=1 Tax=Butyrivibrio sp. TaxID=28121 RepID=UPI0025E4EA0D|nr:CPBP family intramembrane glutamic endopeptidase [Butyrivibrio sp.]MCR5769615.1 CPBP family intramembrane metalloprotease [Butyrivibrio sp.]